MSSGASSGQCRDRAAPPSGQEQARTIEHPDWLRRPEPHITSEYYPYRAVAARVNGHVVVDCVAKASGLGERPLSGVTSMTAFDGGFN
jgi:hypothetical protein